MGSKRKLKLMKKLLSKRTMETETLDNLKTTCTRLRKPQTHDTYGNLLPIKKVYVTKHYHNQVSGIYGNGNYDKPNKEKLRKEGYKEKVGKTDSENTALLNAPIRKSKYSVITRKRNMSDDRIMTLAWKLPKYGKTVRFTKD